MKNGFRQSMAWLHTWAGLLLGWLLFAIFLTGSASYFREEITQWMEVEPQRGAAPEVAALLALQTLQEKAPDAQRWFIDLPDARQPRIQVAWKEPGKKGRFQREQLDARSGEVVQVRDTLGGEFFYRFHFELKLPNPWGRYIVGFAAVFMLVALVSGVITHKKIFKDFFTLRPRKGQRSWLDFHNVSGVLALPFYLVITYSGLVTLLFLYMPWGLASVYGKDKERFFVEVGRNAPKVEAAGVAAAPGPVADIIAQVAREWAGGPGIKRIEVEAPGDANAQLMLQRDYPGRLNFLTEERYFSAVSGAPLPAPGNDSAVATTYGVLYGLHIARFADGALRWLLFAGGLLGSAMIASGLVLWTVKRRPQAAKQGGPDFGHRVVERLNIAVIAGLPLAIAVFFWSNRLLPVELPARAGWELRAFFAAWALALMHATLRPVMAGWREQLSAAAVLFLALPLLNLVATPQASLLRSLAGGHAALAGFDLTVFGLGLLLAAAVFRLERHSMPSAPRHRARMVNAEEGDS